MTKITTARNSLISLIFPPYCLACRQQRETYLCQDCKKKILTHPEICIYSHRYSRDFRTHLDRRTSPETSLDGCIIAFLYDGIMKKSISGFKYYHRYHLGHFFAEQLSLHIMSNSNLLSCKPDNTIITGVPSHWRRMHFVKGYNQSYILAKLVGRQLGFSFIPLCRKIRHTKSQVSLKRDQRIENLKNVFVTKKSRLPVEINTIILIDDVVTTGSTLNLVAKSIKDTYPHVRIWAASLARQG